MPSEIDVFREYITTQDDVSIGKPATEEEIGRFETRYNVKLPADVREYFFKINGVSEKGFIELHALHEWQRFDECAYDRVYIASVLEEPSQYFRFGHYDISVWDWSIKLIAIPDVATPVIVTHGQATKIAENFSEFLFLYRTADPLLLLGY